MARAKKPMNIVAGPSRTFRVQSESDTSKWYHVDLNENYTCDCASFAIARNRAKNKQPDLEVTCKHIKAVETQYPGLDFKPLTAAEYDAAANELRKMIEELRADD